MMAVRLDGGVEGWGMRCCGCEREECLVAEIFCWRETVAHIYIYCAPLPAGPWDCCFSSCVCSMWWRIASNFGWIDEND